MVEVSKASVTQALVSEDEHDQRLDNYLLKICKGVPKSHLYRIVRSGEVRVNGKRVEECSSCINTDEMRMQLFRLEEEVYLLKKELRRLKGEAEPEHAPKVDVVEEHEK